MRRRRGREVLGRAPAHIGDTPWMDAALLQAAGIETVVCGAAGAGRPRRCRMGRSGIGLPLWRRFSPAPHSNIADSRRARPNR